MKIYLAAVIVDGEWSYLMHRQSNPCLFWSKQEAKDHIRLVAENSPRIRYRLLELACKEVKFTLPVEP